MNPMGIISTLGSSTPCSAACTRDSLDSHAVIRNGQRRLIRTRLRQLHDSFYKVCVLMLGWKYLLLSIKLRYSGKAGLRIPASATARMRGPGRSTASLRDLLRVVDFGFVDTGYSLLHAEETGRPLYESVLMFILVCLQFSAQPAGPKSRGGGHI